MATKKSQPKTKEEIIKEVENLLAEKQNYLNQIEGVKAQTIGEINFMLGKIEGLKDVSDNR